MAGPCQPLAYLALVVLGCLLLLGELRLQLCHLLLLTGGLCLQLPFQHLRTGKRPAQRHPAPPPCPIEPPGQPPTAPGLSKSSAPRFLVPVYLNSLLLGSGGLLMLGQLFIQLLHLEKHGSVRPAQATTLPATTLPWRTTSLLSGQRQGQDQEEVSWPGGAVQQCPLPRKLQAVLPSQQHSQPPHISLCGEEVCATQA